MKRIPRAVYTVEYKVAAVRQVLGGKKAAEVARELGVVEQTLHNWIKACRGGKLSDGTGKPVSPEQMENSRLRAELARARMELEIVKKAAAYFARESL
jgi:transposase